MDKTAIKKARRERLRGMILAALYMARPVGTNESVILSIIRGEFPDCNQEELRKELDYLSDRKVIELRRTSSWFAEINRYGVDLVEGSIECEPGIDLSNIEVY